MLGGSTYQSRRHRQMIFCAYTRERKCVCVCVCVCVWCVCLCVCVCAFVCLCLQMTTCAYTRERVWNLSFWILGFNFKVQGVSTNQSPICSGFRIRVQGVKMHTMSHRRPAEGILMSVDGSMHVDTHASKCVDSLSSSSLQINATRADLYILQKSFCAGIYSNRVLCGIYGALLRKYTHMMPLDHYSHVGSTLLRKHTHCRKCGLFCRVCRALLRKMWGFFCRIYRICVLQLCVCMPILHKYMSIHAHACMHVRVDECTCRSIQTHEVTCLNLYFHVLIAHIKPLCVLIAHKEPFWRNVQGSFAIIHTLRNTWALLRNLQSSFAMLRARLRNMYKGSFAKYVQGLFCGIHCGICRLFGGTFWVFGGTLRAFFRKIKRCCAARHSRRTEKQRGADASRS